MPPHSDWPGIPQGTPQQGFSPETHRRFCPRSITCDSSPQPPHCRWAWDGIPTGKPQCPGSCLHHGRQPQALPERLHVLQLLWWVRRAPAPRLVSNSCYVQNRRISTGYCWTRTGSDAVGTAGAFWAAAAIWELSAFCSKGLGLSRLRLAILAALCLLALFYFLNLTRILLTNPNLAFWFTLYLLNFNLGLALEKKMGKHFPTKFEVVHTAFYHIFHLTSLSTGY